MNGSKMKNTTYKKVVIVFVGLFLALCQSNNALGRVYIDINSPAFQKFPIAITDFNKLSSVGHTEDLSVWFSDKLVYYLGITGFFNIIDKKAFLDDQKQSGLTTESIRFADWTVIGAEYLVKGSFQYNGRELVADFYLYDVIKGEAVTAKRYAGKITDRNEMVRKFAGEILFALTGDGGVFDTKLAFVLKKGQTSDVYTINFDGTELSRVTNNKALTLSPRWSPDGRYISFTSYKDRNPDLYITAVGSLTAKKISGYDGINLAGSWSKDGRNLLVTLSKDGNQNIYVMNLGAGNLKRLTNNFAIDVSPSWSPDNQKIAFVSNRDGSPQIYTMNTDGTGVRRLTYDGKYNTSPSWSPTGKRIAYEGLAGGRFQIFLKDEDGSAPAQLTFDNEDHESPSWSPDGRYLVFSSRGKGKNRVYIMNATGQNKRIVYESASGCLTPSWSPRLK